MRRLLLEYTDKSKSVWWENIRSRVCEGIAGSIAFTTSLTPIMHVEKGKGKAVEVVDISDSESPGPSFKRKRTELVIEDFIEITSEEDGADFDDGSVIEITDSDSG